MTPRSNTLSALGMTAFWVLPLTAAPPEKHAGNCTDAGCHGDFARRAVVHSPIETGTCEACHETASEEAHKFKPVATGAKLCTECHEEEKFQGKSVHNPVAEGRCLACHDPHGSKTKGLLRLESVGAVCMDCHGETMEGLAFAHGPAASGQCTACHVPHAGEHKKLLRGAGNSLCLECHDDLKERLASAKRTHQPVEGDCGACHKPHGAANKALLTSVAPQLCLDCHDNIAEQLQATCKHSPVSAEGGCATCHDPHASSNKGLLTKATSSELCLSCHSKEIQAEGRTVANIAAQLAANPHQHGPVANGDCAACHNAHGSKSKALALHAYPSGFYAPFQAENYKLCFECHEATALESASTEDATGFRNGSRNLHFVHVNKPVKGRTCRACHEPHASKNDKHVAESVRFGQWSIPINFRPTPTGGSCESGCHRPYRYDREQPVANVAFP